MHMVMGQVVKFSAILTNAYTIRFKQALQDYRKSFRSIHNRISGFGIHFFDIPVMLFRKDQGMPFIKRGDIEYTTYKFVLINNV